MFFFQVLADHARVGEGHVAVTQGRDAAQGAQFAKPGRLAEGRNDLQLIVQALFQQVETHLAHERRERGAIEGQAHREVLI
ncbi:hypothetical protein D3C84_1118870 [compost metagenome]